MRIYFCGLLPRTTRRLLGVGVIRPPSHSMTFTKVRRSSIHDLTHDFTAASMCGSSFICGLLFHWRIKSLSFACDWSLQVFISGVDSFWYVKDFGKFLSNLSASSPKFYSLAALPLEVFLNDNACSFVCRLLLFTSWTIQSTTLQRKRLSVLSGNQYTPRMGRKKIQINRITDERNRQVC